MGNNYTIGELVLKLGIGKETIRYYEKIGILSKPKKDKNGYRIYGEEDLEQIKFINMVKRFGFTLKEIKELINNEILCCDLEGIKEIIDAKEKEIDLKLLELGEKKKLIEKISKVILELDIKKCNEIEKYL